MPAHLADYCAQRKDGSSCSDISECHRSFRYVLERSDDLRAEVIARLKMHGIPTVLRQAFLNIYDEGLLSCRFWRGLLEKLARVPGDVGSLPDVIRQYMRSTRFQGPNAKVRPETVLGRVTTREELAGHFVRNAYFPDELAATLSIEEALSIPVGEVRTKWATFELGRYVMWATFDPSGKRPFDDAGTDARRLRGRLGLNRRELNKPVFTLEYTLPPGQTAHLPTVAEAYASDPWLPSFRSVTPEQADEGFGLTHAIEEYADEPGLPEVVHAPVCGASLAFTPGEIA